jgi:serine kinase of HPr protein (carbohydrate metabolism regulator)
MTSPAPTVHATCILIDDDGVLLRGPSGAGKSSLARALVAAATSAGRFAAFVADDRVILEAAGGRIVARAPAALAGLAEHHGIGIVGVDHEAAAVVRLVVDLVPAETMQRMPEPAGTRVELAGVAVARIAVPARSAGVAGALVTAALAAERVGRRR